MSATKTNAAAEALVDRYIATWNETDPAKRRALIAATFTAAVSYRDPLASSDGFDQVDALIAGVQQRFPAHRFRALGKIDSHGDRLRFQWALAEGDAEALVIGTDVAVLAADNRMQSVTGFFDRVPAPPAT